MSEKNYTRLPIEEAQTTQPSASERTQPRASKNLSLSPNDQARSQVLDDVLKNANTELMPSNENPMIAMREMLRHVHVDPDGGIINIANDRKGQHNKIRSLRKGKLETILALFAVFRTFTNPASVIFFACRVLYSIWIDAPWVQEFRAQTAGLRLPVHMLDLFVFTSLAEILGLSIILVIVTRYALSACCCYEPPVSDRVHPKYLAMAELYWHYLPYLQGFSALAPLGLIHPNLLTKSYKSFSIREDLARAKLETFLKADPNDMNDDDIVGKVIGVIYHDKYTEEDRREKASEHLESSPDKVLQLLQASDVSQDRPYLEGRGCDADAVFGCRHACFTWCDFFVMGAAASLCFLIGSIAFLTKIVRTFCLFLDEDLPLIYPLCFFLMFLNQALGIVPLARLLTWRIETFMFGGPDAQVSTEEMFVMRYYLGCLVEAVWHNHELSWFQKMCVMFQLDDDNLQRLVIEDGSKQKSTTLLHIRQYMHEAKQVGWFKAKVISIFK